MAVSTSNSSARISWDPPELPNGEITAYYIKVERYNGQGVIEERNISGTGLRQLEVTGLGEAVAACVYKEV